MAALTPNLTTHVDWIDEQHRELFDRLNALKYASSERMTKEAEEILHYLGKYIIKHFGNEENAMLQTHYPQYEWHKEWHQSYILKLESLMGDFLAEGATPEFIAELIKSIEDGISKHIEKLDIPLGRYIKGRRSA